VEDDADADLVAKMEQHFPRLRAEPRMVIFRENDAADCAYVVLSGAVEISTQNKTGDRVQLTTLRRGQIFGELALLNDNRRTASAQAAEDSELLIINTGNLANILAKGHPFLRFWIAHLNARVIDLSKRVEGQEGK